jgi:hypothetical protein
MGYNTIRTSKSVLNYENNKMGLALPSPSSPVPHRKNILNQDKIMLSANGDTQSAPILTTTIDERAPLWKSKHPIKNFQHITGAKNLRLGALKMVRRTLASLSSQDVSA